RVAVIGAEAAWVVANMLAAAVEVRVDDGAGAAEDQRSAPGAPGGGVSPAVVGQAGARELPLDRASVRAGGGGGEAGLGAGARRAALPAAGRPRLRRRRADDHRPRRGGAGGDRRRVQGVLADRLGLRRGWRVRGPAVPAPRLWRCVGRRAALGSAHARTGAGS